MNNNHLPLIKTIGHTWENEALLEQALTLAYGSKKAPYERLEFLGDRVLGLVIAEMLYKHFPKENEGDLAKRHTKLVRAETAVLVAEEIGLEHYLNVAKSEEAVVNSKPEVYLCDVLEAVIGALYIDGGFDVAKDFVVKYFHSLMIKDKVPPQDSKSKLQEWAQGKGFEIPKYTVQKVIGPEHAPIFTIAVEVGNFEIVTAAGSSKKKAEQNAAKAFLMQHKVF